MNSKWDNVALCVLGENPNRSLVEFFKSKYRIPKNYFLQATSIDVNGPRDSLKGRITERSKLIVYCNRLDYVNYSGPANTEWTSARILFHTLAYLGIQRIGLISLKTENATYRGQFSQYVKDFASARDLDYEYSTLSIQFGLFTAYKGSLLELVRDRTGMMNRIGLTKSWNLKTDEIDRNPYKKIQDRYEIIRGTAHIPFDIAAKLDPALRSALQKPPGYEVPSSCITSTTRL